MGPDSWLRPVNWPRPDGVRAWQTTRGDAEFNLASHVGDDPARVQARRASLEAAIGMPVQWMEQVHGNEVARLDEPGEAPKADSMYTREAGFALAVMTADCLPILMCDRSGTEIGAAHAGWRGLADGVLENTVACFECPPQDIIAWLGPAISKRHFEVGPEVRDTFLGHTVRSLWDGVKAAFRPSSRPGHYYCDLYQLATLRLAGQGVREIYPLDACTFADKAQYFSYRRDGQTGRMASLIALAPSNP